MFRARSPWSFVPCFVLVLARGWQRLARPDIWGEDGINFIREALEHGWRSLWLPMGGYFNVFQRAITLFWIAVAPLPWLATLICVSSYLLFALIAARIVSDDYEWLIPSVRARGLTALAICLAPGLGEMLGNLSNINWFLLLWVGMVALKSPAKRITTFETIACGVIFFSVGTGILLLPLLFLRRRSTDVGVLILLLVSVAVQIIAFPHATNVAPRVLQLIPFSFGITLRTLFLGPWLGELFTIEMYRAAEKFWLGVLSVVCAAVAIYVIRCNRQRREFLWIGCFALPIINWPILLFVARPQSQVGGPGFDWVAKEMYLHRYTFPGAVAAILFWMTLLAPRELLKERAPTLAAFFLFVNLVQPLYRFSIGEYGPERHWEKAAPLLAKSVATGCPARVLVPQYPKEFSWEYRSPLGCPP